MAAIRNESPPAADGVGSRWTRSGGEMVVVLAAVLIAFLAGRGSVDGDRVSMARHDGGPGPTGSVAGVPVGFARTRAGAVAAVLNHGLALSALVLEPRSRRARVLEVVGTQRFARAAGERLDAGAARAPRSAVGRGLAAGARTVYRAAPLGYRVVRWSRDEAEIETWSFAVVANDAGLGARAFFQTSTSRLRWERRDWRLDEVRSRPGPAPAIGTSEATGDGTVALLAGLRAPRYAP